MAGTTLSTKYNVMDYLSGPSKWKRNRNVETISEVEEKLMSYTVAIAVASALVLSILF